MNVSSVMPTTGSGAAAGMVLGFFPPPPPPPPPPPHAATATNNSAPIGFIIALSENRKVHLQVFAPRRGCLAAAGQLDHARRHMRHQLGHADVPITVVVAAL